MTGTHKRREIESMADLAKTAIEAAFARLVLETRKTNGSLVIWKDGKVRHIPATEIELSSDSKDS